MKFEDRNLCKSKFFVTWCLIVNCWVIVHFQNIRTPQCMSKFLMIRKGEDFRWIKKPKIATILGAKSRHFRCQHRNNKCFNLIWKPLKFPKISWKTIMQLSERHFRYKSSINENVEIFWFSRFKYLKNSVSNFEVLENVYAKNSAKLFFSLPFFSMNAP